MGRVFSATKRLAFGAPHTRRFYIVHAIGQSLFPFLYPKPAQEDTLNYDRVGDHLYLPSHKSAKELMQFETLSLAIVLASAFVLFVATLTAFFSTSVLVILTALVSLFYLVFMLFKLWVVARSFRYRMIDYTPEELAHVTDEELPVYTILVPLRDEAEVMEQIVKAMRSIDYPEDKIDLIITVESFDVATREAIERVGIPANWRVCILPDTQPKTKPKALNVAFREVRGEFLVIYDAEIIPDRDQLKKAYLAFREHPEIGCFQTRLDHYNYDQNLLTKLFNTEFSFQYDLFLPGLQSFNAPIPLSGHSTHFRTEAVRRIGAWDPYNVAEDCEMGTRLYCHGYRTGFINSYSREEAASTVMSWVRQRTRWMKGFIQTTIVHLRHPAQLVEQLGSIWRALVFLLLVPGTVLLNLLNFFSFFILLAWVMTGAETLQDVYPMSILYIASTAAIAGGFTFVYLNLIALYNRGRFHLVRYWFLTPLYWFLLAWATLRAIWQLRDAKHAHAWEKTEHGTHLSSSS